MSCGNPMKHLFQDSKKSFLDFSWMPAGADSYDYLASDSKPKYDDDIMECLQFGLCERNSNQ